MNQLNCFNVFTHNYFPSHFPLAFTRNIPEHRLHQVELVQCKHCGDIFVHAELNKNNCSNIQ